MDDSNSSVCAVRGIACIETEHQFIHLVGKTPPVIQIIEPLTEEGWLVDSRNRAS